jgi:glutamyl-Q tRNA(Asp) synthetase
LYVGRFAPSPTGPLHFGSLATALASYLEARRHGGKWLLRIEDLDPPRVQPGAADHILGTLEALGLHWDGEVEWQSRHLERFDAALDTLAARGAVYPCRCSRSEIAEAFRASGLAGPLRYPGTCRRRGPVAGRATALRLDVSRQPEITFDDALQGRCRCLPADEFGDFVLKRRDGLHAYQLAVVVDDHAQGVTHVVRGTDLLEETPKQIALQHALGYDTPAYLHVPVATHPGGQKLSKQSGAAALDAREGSALLCRTLQFLRQPLPQHGADATPEALLAFAAEHWCPAPLAKLRAIALDPAS